MFQSSFFSHFVFSQLLVEVREDVNRDVPVTTYEDIAQLVLGDWGARATIAAMCLTQVGISCAYVLFVASQMHSLLPVFGVPLWAVIVSPVFLGLMLLRDIRHLALVSMFALSAVVLALATVLFYGFAVVGVHFNELQVWPTNFFLFFGIAVFAFEGINLAVPVAASMREPHRYNMMLNFVFLVIVPTYMTFALLGYSFFGVNTAPIVTGNLQNTPLVIVVKASLVFEVLCTYPVQMYPVLLLMEQRLFGSQEHSCTLPALRTAQHWKRNGMRALLVVCTVGVSVVIPYFEVVLNIVGGLGNGVSGFVIPATLHFVRFRQRSPKWRLVLHAGIALFGVAAAVLVTVFSIIKLVHLASSGAPE